jgi:hypothetical protein
LFEFFFNPVWRLLLRMGDAKSAQERLDAESAMDLSSELKVGPISHIPAVFLGGPHGNWDEMQQ